MKQERGFALLMVFLMAAIISIMLYRQLPRVAFESQRDKEELLIERGEQYKRGIQLYFIAYKKYPTKMEDLEDTNHKRYLRRRYIDPMTGKDEWRLIHVNGAGLLTDSLVTKPPTADGKDDKSQVAGATGATGTTGATGATGATGTNPGDAPPEVNAAVLRRPSDRPLVGNPGAPPMPTGNVDPNNPNYPPITTNYPPITLAPAGATGPQGQPGVNQPPGFNPRQPVPGQQLVGQPQIGQPGQPPFPGQNLPGQPGFNPQNPAQIQGQVPNLPGQGGGGQPTPFQQPGINPGGTQGAPPNPALGAIQSQLLGQRPPQGGGGSAFNNSMPAGGLAGVASTATGPTIKTYKDRNKYNEWEFIFDMKQGMPGQQQPGTLGPQNNAPGTGPQTPPKQQ
jgi:hypothetical protein